MHKFFGKKTKPEDKAKLESSSKFVLGKSHVPTKLDRDKIPPLVIVDDYPSVDQVALEQLRQRQRSLGLFDEAGYLYDPERKRWIAPNIRIEGLHDNLNYFIDWPEVLNGLPAGAERVDDSDDDCEACNPHESAFSETIDHDSENSFHM